VPNRFQRELARKDGVIAGRRWSCQQTRGRRVPVELRPLAGEGPGFAKNFIKNDILASRAQRAFAVLDSAGAWRRLAAEYLASGDESRAAACKRTAHDHLFHAVRARLEAAPITSSPGMTAEWDQVRVLGKIEDREYDSGRKIRGKVWA